MSQVQGPTDQSAAPAGPKRFPWALLVALLLLVLGGAFCWAGWSSVTAARKGADKVGSAGVGLGSSVIDLFLFFGWGAGCWVIALVCAWVGRGSLRGRI